MQTGTDKGSSKYKSYLVFARTSPRGSVAKKSISKPKSHFQNVSVRSSSISTTDILGIFRGLKFSPNVEIGRNGRFEIGS